MADKSPELSEIAAAHEANKDQGDTMVLVKGHKKILGGLISIPTKEEKHLLSTEAGESLLNKYEYSLKDGLTGLLKKDAWTEEAKRFYEFSSREGLPFAILYIDINNFKHFNDDVSHEFGDEVIKLVANSIKESTRESDVDGRLGGDEFAVAATGINEDIVEEIENRINLKLEELATESELMSQYKVKPTVTIGHQMSINSLGSFESILNEADLNMQKLKSREGYVR